MNSETWIVFGSGALTVAYVVLGLFLLRFWTRTRDDLFLNFALAFWLFALNQIISALAASTAREIRYEYVLRVLGFLLIIVAIVRKNAGAGTRRPSHRR